MHAGLVKVSGFFWVFLKPIEWGGQKTAKGQFVCLKDLCFLSGAQTEEAGGKLREQLGADGVQARDGGGLVEDSNRGGGTNGWI